MKVISYHKWVPSFVDSILNLVFIQAVFGSLTNLILLWCYVAAAMVIVVIAVLRRMKTGIKLAEIRRQKKWSSRPYRKGKGTAFSYCPKFLGVYSQPEGQSLTNIDALVCDYDALFFRKSFATPKPAPNNNRVPAIPMANAPHSFSRPIMV